MCFFILILFRIDILVSTQAHSEDSDQTPRSDPGLHCLPMSQKLDVMLIWVNV